MPVLFLLCGLPGSGKTTLAMRLERERPALRLTPDEWIGALAIDSHDEEKRAAVEALQWEVAAQALVLGVDVVLDWGFWSRSERDDSGRERRHSALVQKFAFWTSRVTSYRRVSPSATWPPTARRVPRQRRPARPVANIVRAADAQRT